MRTKAGAPDPHQPAGTFARRTFLLGTSLAAVSIATGAPAAAVTSMQVSSAKTDITPALGFPMGGFATESSPRLAEGVNEPLLARCIVIWDNGVPNVIVSADVLAFGRSMHQRIRSGVVALGVGSADFVLNATHTHNGPALVERLDPSVSYAVRDATVIADYSTWLVNKIVDLVRVALRATRTTCTLDYRVSDEDFSFNRAGLSYVERAVPVLVARSLDGSPRAVLFSYGAHPVAAGGGTEFDPDYPSEAIKTIEGAYPGAFAQFVLGPAGDQNPLTMDGVVQSDAYGRDLGLTVANDIVTPGRPLSGPLTSALSEVQLPLDVTDTPGNRAALVQVFNARQRTASIAYERRHGEVMQSVAKGSGPLASTVPLPIQRWRFVGNPGLTMIFSGGEVVSGYAVYFRARNGGSNQLWFSAYANEVPCYIPSDEILARPGYEAGYSADYPGVAAQSMAAYGHLAHFRRRAPGSTTVGVEQTYISGVQAVL